MIVPITKSLKYIFPEKITIEMLHLYSFDSDYSLFVLGITFWSGERIRYYKKKFPQI
jgi:hypothetical protein